MEKLVERIMELFAGLDRGYGEFRIDEDTYGEKDKKGGRAVTKGEPWTSKNWEDHLAGKVGFGVVPIRDDGTVSWACIDVDAYGKNVIALANEFVQKYSLPFVVCRSKSGGAHVFVFFKVPIPAKNVVKKLAAFAKAMGFGGSEIFPKQTNLAADQFGNWLNMPYFDWEISTRYAIDSEGERMDLPRFLDHAFASRLSIDGWKKLEVPETTHPFQDGPPCLQTIAREGVPDGMRNNALLQMGVYAKFKHGEDYADKVTEYNATHLKPPLGTKEIYNTVLKSLERRDYGYKCPHLGSGEFQSWCNKTTCMRRKFGIGGAGDDEFDDEVQPGELRKLIYFTPDRRPLNEDPNWEWDINGCSIPFENTESLLNMNAFMVKMVNHLNLVPPPQTRIQWLRRIQYHIKNAVTIELPFETAPAAMTLDHLRKFVEDNSHAKNNRDLWDGLVLKKNESYRFRLESFCDYIRDRSRAIVKAKDIADHLELLGIERHDTTARDLSDGTPQKITFYAVTEHQLNLYDKEEPEQPGVNF